MAEGDFHSIDAVDSRVAGRGAAQGRYQSVRDETHVHQVVLDIFRQVEGDQDPTVTDRQITENTHLPDSLSLPEAIRQQKNATRMVGFKYTAKMAWSAIGVYGDFWLG